eukprot:g4308.t1
MRPLTENELRTFFEKLKKYIGKNISHLIDQGVTSGDDDDDATPVRGATTNHKGESYVFRLHKDRVYYLSENLLKLSTNVGRDELCGAGTCFGNFTKKKNFRLAVTSLDYLADLAVHKVWIKPNSEMSFLYGNHVPKAGIGRMTEGTPQYAGVIVFSMQDVPLGFGVAAQATAICQQLEPTAIAVLHQSDIGEYLRQEDTL